MSFSFVSFLIYFRFANQFSPPLHHEKSCQNNSFVVQLLHPLTKQGSMCYSQETDQFNVKKSCSIFGVLLLSIQAFLVYSSEIEFKIIATTRNDKMITDVIKKIFSLSSFQKPPFITIFLLQQS